MLAKKIKIRTILRQREFIVEQMEHELEEDGNPLYSYCGYIYPENLAYFRTEGFDIVKVMSESVHPVTRGAPYYLFTPKDDINLSEEEMKEAEKFTKRHFQTLL